MEKNKIRIGDGLLENIKKGGEVANIDGGIDSDEIPKRLPSPPIVILEGPGIASMREEAMKEFFAGNGIDRLIGEYGDMVKSNNFGILKPTENSRKTQ